MSFSTSNIVIKTLKGSTFKGKEFKRFAVQNTMFFYMKTVPAVKMNTEADRKRWFKNREYTCSIIINKQVADTIKKNFTGKLAIDKLDADEFRTKFKCEPPSDDDLFWILKLTRHAAYPEGEWNAFQHTLEVGMLEDGKVVKYPMKKIDSEDGKEFSGLIPDVLIGNGSVGDLIIGTTFYKEPKSSEEQSKPIPSFVVIREMVEVERTEGSVNKIDDEELDELGYSGIATYEADGHGVSGEEGGKSDEDSGGSNPADDEDDDESWRTE